MSLLLFGMLAGSSGGRRFVGTEFALVHSNAPATFIIHKRRRSSPTEGAFTVALYVSADHKGLAVPIAAYYVMNANV